MRHQIITIALAAALSLSSLVHASTRIRRYETSTNVHSRLLTATIIAELVNDRDCALVDGFNLQLPMNARITGLTVDASNNCQMTGEVQTVLDAQEAFHEQSSAGKAAALLQAWDATTYPVWVSLPPDGSTTVTIEYEELLARKHFEIPFYVPASPGLPIDLLVMDISISEPETGVASFGIASDFEDDGVSFDVKEADGATLSAHLELENVDKDGLPRLIEAKYDYDPLMIPTGGVVVGSGKCISHIFNPSALLSDATLPKNLVFAIDVSGSMSGQKLADAKRAFRNVISTLTEEDYFTIHTFSDLGTENSWGPSKATNFAKEDAAAFVHKLQTIGGTNLEGAFLDAIERTQTVQNIADEGGYYLVPTVIILTDGQATTGETNRESIARNVRIANSNFRAKIFAIAFGWSADMPLLLGIAIQNGGKAVPIYEGYGDSALQLETFYKTELNSILLQDLTFNIASDVPIESVTQTKFPFFADGNEIAIRAQPTSEEYFSGTVQVVANAISGDGPREWIYEADVLDPPSPMPYRRECTQSFAHTKISEVLDFREASAAIGSELDSYADSIFGVNIEKAIGTSTNLADEAKQYAIDLALDAGLVWPGLTAMVTLENEDCAAIFAEGNPVCEKGGSIGGVEDEDGLVELEEDDGGFADMVSSLPEADADTSMAAPQGQPQPSGNGQQKKGGIGSSSNGNIGTVLADIGSVGPMVMSNGGRSPACSNAPNVLYLTLVAFVVGALTLFW